MQPPPIASPHGDARPPDVALTGRVEWLAPAGCFRMRAHSTLGGRFRCEWKSVKFKPANVLALTLLFPIFALLLLITQYSNGSRRATSLEVWPEGVRMVTPDGARLVRWSNLKMVERLGDDIFLVQGGADLIFSAREGYADESEISRMSAILHQLWSARGANWSATLAQFAPQCLPCQI